MPEGFVSIRSFWSVEEAQLAKIWLESEGIEVFLDGAEFAGMAWIDTNATRGAKLMVPEAAAARALKLLDSKYEPDEVVDPADSQNVHAGEVDVELERSDELSDDDEEEPFAGRSRGGVLTRMRAYKGPVIILYFILIPLILPVLVTIVAFIVSFFSR